MAAAAAERRPRGRAREANVGARRAAPADVLARPRAGAREGDREARPSRDAAKDGWTQREGDAGESGKPRRDACRFVRGATGEGRRHGWGAFAGDATDARGERRGERCDRAVEHVLGVDGVGVGARGTRRGARGTGRRGWCRRRRSRGGTTGGIQRRPRGAVAGARAQGRPRQRQDGRRCPARAPEGHRARGEGVGRRESAGRGGGWDGGGDGRRRAPAIGFPRGR
mmetsp:Transcript_7622/g.30916  ORF Transcript_7622/g.30916 Transcript_7622/m.30916 type:complete len:226 (-) Transcript_7622:19-696(-)